MPLGFTRGRDGHGWRAVPDPPSAIGLVARLRKMAECPGRIVVETRLGISGCTGWRGAGGSSAAAFVTTEQAPGATLNGRRGRSHAERQPSPRLERAVPRAERPESGWQA